MRSNLGRASLVFFICLAIPSILFLANLIVVYSNFPRGEVLQKMTLLAFAERSGFQLRLDLKPRVQSSLENFQLSNGFAAGEVCEICNKNRASCHGDLAREAQRWMRHTFEQGPAWVPLKPFQASLMKLALQYRYDDATLVKLIAYARLLHSDFASMDEVCIRQFKYQCELLTLDQNLQVDITSISFALARQARFNPTTLAMRLRMARGSCGIKTP